ncbi:mitochondrial FAD carrier protein flx1 [Conoideocrella luteorostrata]|uniref:Mitochondrial FAD carrier protein flx1 n=1 Tax=Conoideocrella luteorostrata TaxID=1105319 RepID=A0AAJ0CS89_9HYPO|nr:mitochondrial FAD carrier protein flx1 [Conoideocrella luteorostrata]
MADSSTQSIHDLNNVEPVASSSSSKPRLYMPDRHHSGPSPAIVESAAGLTAGVVATLVVHPLDIVKTRMQIYRSTGPSSAAPTTVAILRSLTSNSQPILLSLYRGLTPNLIGNATSWGSFFFFKSRFERLIARDGRRPTSPGEYFIASGLAGASTSILTNPIWVLKTRMLSSDKGSVGAYPSMLAGARTILQTEGPRGFYRGLGVSLLGVSHGAVQFAVYEPAKRIHFAKRRRVEGQPDSKLTNEATVVISSVAKLVAGAVTYPYQVLRSRMQNYRADERFGRGIAGVVVRIWREEGVVGFYRGLVPGVVRVMPATWVTFLVYENVKYYLPRWTA